MRKKILFISRHAPYGSSTAKEALDAVLAASAYDQNLSILFMDDGVFQLLPDQNAHAIAQKSFAAMLPVLPLYGVDHIYVHQASLEQRSITINELVIESAQRINDQDVINLIAKQDQILSF